MGRDRRRPDHYAKRAQQEGRAARSIYKLEEIDKRWRILSSGHRVLDLGCAPGSWMQYAGERVGARGKVIGYDLKPLESRHLERLPPQVEARVGDVFNVDEEALGEPFDVILSDMAPATMGHHQTDALRSAALAEAAILLADKFLRPEGAIVVKLLEGGEVVGIVNAMRRAYEKVERLRPKATRKESTEVFIIGLGRRKGMNAYHIDNSPEQEGA